jgi:hypothetical protein
LNTFPALRNPQPSTPLRKEDKDAPSGFQAHFQDGPTELDDGKVDKPFVSSRPHEDYVWHPVYKPEGEFGPFTPWPNNLADPIACAAELNAVKVVRLERKTLTDKLAFGMVKFARWGFDFVRSSSPSSTSSVGRRLSHFRGRSLTSVHTQVTGYKHASPEDAIEALKKAGKSDLVSSVSIAESCRGGLLILFVASHRTISSLLRHVTLVFVHDHLRTSPHLALAMPSHRHSLHLSLSKLFARKATS